MRIDAPGLAQCELWLSGLAVLLAIVTQPAEAQSAGEAQRTTSLLALAPPRPGVWEDQVGSGFRRGAVEAAFSTGAGIGTRSLGSRKTHDLALAMARYGRTLGRNSEFIAEMFGGVQTHPRNRHLFGLTSVIRYNFATGGEWVPFVDGGVGPTITSIRDRDLSTAFEFNVQLGTGVHYFLGRDRALTFLYRWLHLSNAGIKHPNDGTNTQMFYLGLTWFH